MQKQSYITTRPSKLSLRDAACAAGSQIGNSPAQSQGEFCPQGIPQMVNQCYGVCSEGFAAHVQTSRRIRIGRPIRPRFERTHGIDWTCLQRFGPLVAGEAIGLKSHEVHSGIVALGNASYHVDTGRLIAASGDDLLLRAQSAQVLSVLVANLGQLVARNTLIDEVWGDIAVTDDSLTQCIADIRRILLDADHAVLKTVPKRGYILHGFATDGPPQVAQDRLDEATFADPFSLVSAIKPLLDPRDILPTLAVLPLRGLLHGEADEFGLFVANEIAGALERSKDVNVISQMSSRNVAVTRQDPEELRRSLNADFIVSGVVGLDGDKAVASLEFSETDTRYVLWSDRFRLPISALSADDDWVEHVVSNIRRTISRNEVRRLRTVPFNELKHFSILHGAVGLMHQLALKDFHQARKLFEHLIELAPHSPAPLAWMARWHVLRVLQGWSDDVQKEARAAVVAAERALDLEPENTLALTSLGFVMTNLMHRLDDAKVFYDAALEIKPNDAQARGLRGMLMAFTDQGAKAQRHTERALHLTPRDPHRFFYLVLAAGANLSAGDCERAVVLAKESRRLNRTHVSTLRTLAAAQAGVGDIPGANNTVAELMQLQPDLRVSIWQRCAPSAEFENGKLLATLLRRAGVPE